MECSQFIHLKSTQPILALSILLWVLGAAGKCGEQTTGSLMLHWNEWINKKKKQYHKRYSLKPSRKQSNDQAKAWRRFLYWGAHVGLSSEVMFQMTQKLEEDDYGKMGMRRHGFMHRTKYLVLRQKQASLLCWSNPETILWAQDVQSAAVSTLLKE